MSGAIHLLPNTPAWRRAYLKHRDFTLENDYLEVQEGNGEKLRRISGKYIVRMEGR